MKKGLLKYILVGVLACAVFLVGFSLIDMLLDSEKTFADGFKSVLDWILGVCFGSSCAYSLWKKDNKKDSGK